MSFGVRNSQNLPRCSLSRSWRYFWTRKINFACFHFGQPISFKLVDEKGNRGNIKSKVSSNTFHKGQIKVFLHICLFFLRSFKYHKILFYEFSCQFLCQTFSLFFCAAVSTNKNTPPTSLNTRITKKGFAKRLNQMFTV